MLIQILFVLLFAVNLLLVWLAYFRKKFKWYRFAGTVLFVVLPLISVIFEQPRFELDYFWWRIAGVVAILFGACLITLAKLAYAGVFTNLNETPKELATGGPYAYVRHPLYLGLVFVFVGWWWLFAAVYAFYFGLFILTMIWAQAYLEEKIILEKTFGGKFLEYRRTAGMFWIK